MSFVLARDPDTVRIPDVAFVRAERVATLADRSRPFPGAPDLAVEVLSPSNTPGEIHAKVADYLAAGTPLVWVVDPESRSVVTYRELLRPVRLSGDDRLDAGEVLRAARREREAVLELSPGLPAARSRLDRLN